MSAYFQITVATVFYSNLTSLEEKKTRSNECNVDWYYPSGQNRQKNSLKEWVFVNSILKIQCYMLSKIHSY